MKREIILSSQEIEVGQLLYVLITKQDSQRLIPVLVEEEITKKNISGITQDYLVLLKTNKAEETVLLSEIQSKGGHVYTSLDDVKQVLLKVSIDKINDIILATEKKARILYPVTHSSLSGDFQVDEEGSSVLPAKVSSKPSLEGELNLNHETVQLSSRT